MPPADDAELCTLLTAFLQADEHARDALPLQIDHALRRTAFRFMPPGYDGRRLVDDVISRTWELLLRKPAGSFDPARGTALAYLATVVRTAVRDVREENAHVVARARDYSSPGVSRRDHAVERRLIWAEVEVIDEVVDLATALQELPPAVRPAVPLIAVQDSTMVDAAVAVGMTRFALKRRLQRWAVETQFSMVS